MSLQLEWFGRASKRKVVAIKKLVVAARRIRRSKLMVKRWCNNDIIVTTNTCNNNSSNNSMLVLVIIEIYNNLHVCVQDNWAMEFVVIYQDLMELTQHNINNIRTRSSVGSCCVAPINIVAIMWSFSPAKGALHCS